MPTLSIASNLRRLVQLTVVVTRIALGDPSGQIEFTIRADAARETLNALKNPGLTHNQAVSIGELHGNQAAIRKLTEFGIKATAQAFADALYASAHSQHVEDQVQQSFEFDLIKPKAAQLLALLRDIESKPQRFQLAIEQRIGLFTPAGTYAHLDGYIVAAGDGGGYAFDDPDFYLNIGLVDDLPFARETTAHELYHAIQNVFAADQQWTNRAKTDRARLACTDIRHLFADIYKEGSATIVGDPSLLTQSHSLFASRQQTDISDGLRHIQNSITLLDLSVLGFRADPPLPFDDVYALDFYGTAFCMTLAT